MYMLDTESNACDIMFSNLSVDMVTYNDPRRNAPAVYLSRANADPREAPQEFLITRDELPAVIHALQHWQQQIEETKKNVHAIHPENPPPGA